MRSGTLTAAKFGTCGDGEKSLTCSLLTTLAIRWRNAPPPTMPRSVVYEIIDHRYGWHLPIFATSNLSPAQMAAQFHDRTMRRISDVCAVIAVDGSTMAELQRSRLRMA